MKRLRVRQRRIPCHLLGQAVGVAGSVRSVFEKILLEFTPDIIYAPWVYPDGWAGVQLGREFGLPVVTKAHGSDIRLLADFQPREQKTVEALCSADGIVTVSQDLADHVIALGADPDRVHVVYDGVDISLFRLGPADVARRQLGLTDARPMILFVGNLVPVKGVDTLIDACALLAAEGLDFTASLIGKGPLRARLARQIRKLGLNGRVTLHGSVPHEQLGDWYRAATVVALASHSEGVPNVLLESAACGTPFVATRVGGIPEIAHLTTSLVVPPGDAPALADALGAFVRYPNGPRRGSLIRSPDEAIADLTHALDQARQRHRAAAPALCAAAPN